MKHRLRVVMALVLVTIGVAYAVVTFSFKETGPAVPNGQQLLSGCDPLTATPSTVPAGSNGGILFTCGISPSTLGALTVNGPVTATLSFNPAPSGYTAIYIVPSGTLCSSTTTSTMQIFGAGATTTVTFTNTATTQYDYCATVTNAPVGGFASWMITWTWNQ